MILFSARMVRLPMYFISPISQELLNLAKVLADFLRLHGFLRPSFSVQMTGTHTETRVRWVQDSDGRGRHQQRCTETITDFSFAIDLSDVFTEDPVIYTIKDDVPAFRGAMSMAVETGGARPIERRTLVDRTTQSVQKDAIEAGRKGGFLFNLVQLLH